MIVAKQSVPSTQMRQKAKNTDCSDFAMDSFSSVKPCEPAAENFNPGDHYRS